jgi:cobaltochelatase CobN
MHVLRIDSHSIDGTADAVDLGQSPADIVALSFTDTDLSVLAAAWERCPDRLPPLRLANLAVLRHPYSVDLYVEKVLSQARFILVRLLGGVDYWRYGVDELAGLARSRGIHLALVPGDQHQDARLQQASTLTPGVLRRLSSYFAAGGIDNAGACLRFIAGLLPAATTRNDCPAGRRDDPGQLSFAAVATAGPDDRHETATPPFGYFAPAMRTGTRDQPLALIVFYRAWMLAEDTAPIVAQANAMALRGFRVTAVYVTSLKDAAVVVALRGLLVAGRPDVILNMTAFSARTDVDGSVLDHADAPVFQLALSGGNRRQWSGSRLGLGPTDLAMNIVLPEFDGRIITGAISFKGETSRNQELEFTRLVHQPDADGVDHAAALALGWTRLRRTPRAERRLACVLSDYPAKAGRTGYAVGLDTPRSVVAIAQRLVEEGFSVGPTRDEATLIAALSDGAPSAALSVAAYERHLMTLPAGFVEQVRAAWGEPRADAAVHYGLFCYRFMRAGGLLIAVQPDRGGRSARKAEYHDPNLPPRHGYVAFYLWLRMVEQVHAIIHCGTHGTLEWLPGKTVALSEACAPRAVLGPIPLIYPFIVNNPGEAAHAKRRIAAVTIGHLTPPLIAAGSHGAASELEGLFEEYADAQSLDPRRAARLADMIMTRARETGLAEESGIPPDMDAPEALLRLDAWLCDLRICL